MCRLRCDHVHALLVRLEQDGAKQNKGRNHGCQHKADSYGIASVFSANLSTYGTIGHVLLMGPLGMSNSMPPSKTQNNRDAWEFKT